MEGEEKTFREEKKEKLSIEGKETSKVYDFGENIDKESQSHEEKAEEKSEENMGGGDSRDANVEELIRRRKEKIASFFGKGRKEGKVTIQQERKVESGVSSGSASDLFEDKGGMADSDALIRERKDKIGGFFKKNYNWLAYLVLAGIVWLAVKIRSSNAGGLRDAATGAWTLGPDLDPFLFLRQAEYIVEHGSLMAIDTMRYVPNGFDMSREFILHPYLIAWFHKIAVMFGSESVVQSAALFPVFMFALTIISFFFLVRIIFVDSLGAKQANVIALVASFFLTILPPLLPRTIAGIPEKESAAFFFLFMAFWLYLSAWKSKGKYEKYVLAVLSGVFTAGMAFVWGGFAYIFLTLAATVLFAFLFGQVDNNKFYVYVSWLLSSTIIMIGVNNKYTLNTIATSTGTAPAVLVLFVLLVHLLIWNTKVKKYIVNDKLKKIPRPVFSLVIAIILGLLVISLWQGPGFIVGKVDSISNSLIKPATSRLIQTVAENRQPYFNEWAGSFGPKFKGYPVFFWLFFAGSIYLFFNMLKIFKTRERWILSGGYLIFLLSIIFSRYAEGHKLNGENSTSLFVYFGGSLLFLAIFGYYYYKYYSTEKKASLKSIDFGFMFLLFFFVLGIVSARGAVRLIMMLVPPTSIIVSYFAVNSSIKVLKIGVDKKDMMKWVVWAAVFFVVVFTFYAGYQYYNLTKSSAANYVPSVYNQQWQKSMQWVRDNTPEDSVFGHWWDYGYWVQSIGKRATVLDGGNVISYWNHFMGRHALAGSDERSALEFLYAHDVSHFLIDSTDIGKYAAFSTIGSDESFDRRSWIPTAIKDEGQTQEKKNSTVFVYPVGTVIDGDINYKEGESEIFLPGMAAGLGGVIVEKIGENEISSVTGAFVYQNQQQNLPLRYAYYNGELIDFGKGVEAGVVIFPRIREVGGGQIQMDRDGALLYLSPRVAMSQLAKYYLYGEENEYYKVAHVEDDIIIENLKSQGMDIGDFAHYQGFRGPIKIWEINYPSDMTLNEDYLEKSYPETLKRA